MRETQKGREIERERVRWKDGEREAAGGKEETSRKNTRKGEQDSKGEKKY